MYIAICDDDNDYIIQLESYMQKLRGAFDDINWCSFKNAEVFLDEYEKNKDAFDILITDIEMDTMNGVELANSVRESNKSIIIFFVTSHTDYAIKCFKAEPLNFWVKPVDYDMVEYDIKRAAERIQRSKRYITIMEDRHPVRININDIVYIEKYDRKTIIHIAGGNAHTTNKLISHINNDLPDNLFVMSHQSFIVNLLYIKAIKEKELFLRGVAEVLPVGRTYTKNLRKKFVEFNEMESFG